MYGTLYGISISTVSGNFVLRNFVVLDSKNAIRMLSGDSGEF